MTQYINTATNQIITVANSVQVSEVNGVYVFSLLGQQLNWPTTLVPYTPPAPSAPTLAQAQAIQSSVIKTDYENAILSCNVTVNGTNYDLDLDTSNSIAILSAAISAQTALASPVWSAGAVVSLGQICTVGGVPLYCSTGGTTGSSAPTVPTTIGVTVNDNTAQWELFARSAELTNGTFVWFTADEIVSVSQQVEVYLHIEKDTLIGLTAAINNDTTTTSVESVVWPSASNTTTA